jgi:hypothetical protein
MGAGTDRLTEQSLTAGVSLNHFERSLNSGKFDHKSYAR